MLSQLWGKVGKVLGGVFLAAGGTISIGILFGVAIGHPGGAALTVLLTLLVFFGLAPVSLGGLLLYTGFRADRHAIRDRFFHLLQLNQGRLSVLDFAAATRLEPTIARRHLDGWAKEFSAHFEVTDDGDIDYIFSNRALPVFDYRSQTLKQTVKELLKSL